jgi:two-component system sensor histidine kinase UhpB
MGAKAVEEVKDKTDFDIFPRELATQYYADEQMVINSGVPLIGREEKLIDVDGKEHSLLTTKLPFRNEQGKIIGTFSVSRDINELKRVESALRQAHEKLEVGVQERTAELARANEALRMEIAERKRVEAELRKSEEKYRTLFEESKDVVFFSSPEGRFLDINRAGVELYGYDSKEQLLRIDVKRDLYAYPQDREIFQQELVRKGHVKDFEMILKQKDGKELVVLETAIAVRGADGDVVAYQGITHDITERKQAEEALLKARDELELRVQERTVELAQANRALQMEIAERKRAEEALRDSEERYRTIFEESRDAIYITSRDGKIVEMNRYALDLFGYSKDEMQGQDIRRLYVHPSDRLRFQREIEKKGYVMDYAVEMRKKDGTKIDCLLTSAVWWAKDGNVLGYQGIIRDITERKRAEVELRDSRQMLREFSARLQEVREEEKRRIAREIHDELGQVLTALKIDLFWLRSKLDARSQSGRPLASRQVKHESIMKKIKSILLLINRAKQDVRRISTELRPIVLDDLGLIPAIEWQAQEFERRSSIGCEIRSHLQETRELDQDHATAIFRIFQETLTNIARHANATKVVVTLCEEDGHLIMRVRDNGKGIADSKILSPKSLGLMGMRERAFLLGGDITVKGSPGNGTVVTVRIPRMGKEMG